MAAFGGFCPLPIRLGGDSVTGWTAEQHARVAADLAAVDNSATFARITLTIAAGVVTLHSYLGLNGVGLTFAPTIVSGSPGVVTLTWPVVVEDEYETIEPIALRHATATVHAATMSMATAVVQNIRTVVVRIFNAAGTLADGKVSITAYGWDRSRRIGHYDGATDKTNATRETVPYAWLWYNEYTGAMGSGFTKATSGLVHAMKLALSRMECAVQRGAEKMNANSHPDSCDDLLGEWVSILKVRIRGDETRHEVRQRCAAKFKAVLGNSPSNIDEVVSSLLGAYFQANLRTTGASLAVPPPTTAWPGISPGGPAYDLGGGTWYSERSHLTVSVSGPSDINDAAFRELFNVELYNELDRDLPAWMTFNGAINASTTGFLLDISHLDFTGLT